MALADIIDRFAGIEVLVVGDIMADHYVRGSVSRTSPEAPVPILAVEEEEWLPGGAANVARNLVSLGAEVHLVGLVGEDAAGSRLAERLAGEPRLHAHLLTDPTRPTVEKTRCVAQGQQMLRIDRETTSPIEGALLDRAMETVEGLLPKCRGVIVSDYAKGFLPPEFLRRLGEAVCGSGVPMLVDPKGLDFARYAGATVVTPNRREASEFTRVPIRDDASAERAATAIQEVVAGEAVIVTRGAAGVTVRLRDGTVHHLRARAREVYDVTGAGDTFIGVVGLGVSAGAEMRQAAELGNLAAGIAVGLAGVATVSPQALRRACAEEITAPVSKRRTLPELESICRSLRQKGRRIVFTNGFFDLLHYGHVQLLQEARRLGDVLVVAVNSDESTRRLKGPPRPILKQAERLDVLGALPAVDHLIVFEDDTPVELLRRLHPDVLVKGGPAGSGPEGVVGREIVEEYGGEVRLLWFDNQPSITGILERARSAGGEAPAT